MDKSRFLNPLQLLEEARKGWDYFISDEIVYAAEVRDGEHIRRQEGYIKDYIEGRLWFEFVAQFASHGIGNQYRNLVWLIEACPHELFITRELKADFPKDWRNNPMFVFIHQVLNDTEKFRFWSMPSVIWLKVLDSTPSLTREKTDIIAKQTSARLVRGMGFRQTKREVDIPFLSFLDGDARFFASLHGERPSDMVKRGTKVAKNVTNNQTPIKPNRRLYVKLVDSSSLESFPLSCIRKIQLAFSKEGDIWLARGTTDSHIKAIDVLIRPLNLELGAIKWVHSKTIQRNEHIV